MCGIFGATTKEQFKTLYNLNKKRGNFAFGCCLLAKHRSTSIVDYQPGEFNINDKSLNGEYSYYLGHSQAPTSSATKFSKKTSHPFVVNDWIVAHNGVLSNFSKLKEHFLPNFKNPVDSSIIPELLCLFEQNTRDFEVETILQVMEVLEGTYSCWIFNTKTKNLYISRCGSTLYGDILKSEFSSCPVPGYDELDDNSLYTITNEGITFLNNFKGNNPFFVL